MRGGGRASWSRLERAITGCTLCPRLRAHCRQVAATKRRAYRDEVYWGRPVPGFGDRNARMLLVGLAPGAHGSNRTGRMFTGDASGDFLYGSLWRLGLASSPRPVSRDDGLVLHGVFISAVARCAPPQNRPTPREQERCRPYLAQEIERLGQLEVIVALGGIAWTGLRNLLRSLHRNLSPQPVFGHGARWNPGPALPVLFASYHPSRQNTQTGRLTASMLDRLLDTAWTSSPRG